MTTEPMLPLDDLTQAEQTDPNIVPPETIPMETIVEEEELQGLPQAVEEPATEIQLAGPVRSAAKAIFDQVRKQERLEPEMPEAPSAVRVEPGMTGTNLVIEPASEQEVDQLRRVLGEGVDLVEIVRPNLVKKSLLDETEKQYLASLYQAFDDKFSGVGDKRTLEELLAEAQELGMDRLILDLMQTKPGQAFNKVETARALYVRSNLLATLQNAQENGTTEELRHALALVSNLAPRIENAASEAGAAQGVRSAFGRTVEAPGDLTSVTEILKRYDNSGIGDAETEEIRVLLAALPPDKKMKFASKILLGVNKGLNMIGEAYISSILSGPPTHAVNVVANTLFNFYQVPERALGGAIGAARTGLVNLTGWKGKIGVGRVSTDIFKNLSDEDRVYAEEAIVMAQATVRGIVNGTKAGMKALATEEKQFGRRGPTGEIEGASKIDLLDDQTKAISADYLGIPKDGEAPFLSKEGQLNALGRFIDYTGIIVRALGPRLLLLEDEFAKGMSYQQELEAHTMRRLNRLKKEGASDDVMRMETQRMLSGLDDDVNEAAIDYALRGTFQAPLEGFQKRVGVYMSHPLMKPIIAFYKTPQWIVNEMAARTPLAALTPRFYRAMSKGGAEADMALSRVVMGTGLLATLSYLASGEMVDGIRITGAYPDDPAMRQAWIRGKIMPYSIGIRQDDGSYHQIGIDRFQPISGLLSMAGDLANFSTYGSDEDTQAMYAMAGAVLAEDNFFVDTVNTGKSIGKQLGTMPMMEGFTDIMEVFGQQYENIDQRISRAQELIAKKYTQAGMAAITPYSSLVATVERTIDPDASNVNPTNEQLAGRYYVSSMRRGWYEALNRVKSRTPILSEDVEVKLNMYAEKPTQCENGVWCMISPVRWYGTETHTGSKRGRGALVDKEQLRLGLGVREPKDTQRGVKMSVEEYNEMIIRINSPMPDRIVGDEETTLTFVDELYETIQLQAYDDAYDGDKLNMLREVLNSRKDIVLDEMFEMVDGEVSVDARGSLAQRKKIYDEGIMRLGKAVPQGGWYDEVMPSFLDFR